jgi:hypothetical protein
LRFTVVFALVPIFHLDRVQPFGHNALVEAVALALEERCEREAWRVAVKQGPGLRSAPGSTKML